MKPHPPHHTPTHHSDRIRFLLVLVARLDMLSSDRRRANDYLLCVFVSNPPPASSGVKYGTVPMCFQPLLWQKCPRECKSSCPPVSTGEVIIALRPRGEHGTTVLRSTVIAVACSPDGSSPIREAAGLPACQYCFLNVRNSLTPATSARYIMLSWSLHHGRNVANRAGLSWLLAASLGLASIGVRSQRD